jgi:hypothetical protein
MKRIIKYTNVCELTMSYETRNEIKTQEIEEEEELW